MYNLEIEDLFNSQVENPDTVESAFIQANEHRDYTIYNWRMDAALDAKAQAIVPHFDYVNEGDVIVDVGSGTGKLAEKVALEFHGAKVVALDMSHELLEVAEKDKSLIDLKYGNAMEQNFPDNSVNVKYFSTSGHEVESFGGSGGMQKAVEVSMKELKPDGVIVIRDFVVPDYDGNILMDICSSVGEDTIPQDPNQIDYSKLSTKALFDCFVNEFQGGNAFEYEYKEVDGKQMISLPARYAYEFYMRKDYTENWRQEIKETYGYWKEEQGKQILSDAGFIDVEAVADPNQYILTNRLIDKIQLYKNNEAGIEKMDFPPTHMVWKGRKPNRIVIGKPEEIDTVDYQKCLETISINPQEKKIIIGESEFVVDDINPIVGYHTEMYTLDGEEKVIKIPRRDNLNVHSAFKTFLQSIEHQDILEEYGVSHAKIVDYDRNGPPYRYYVQEKISDAPTAAELIFNGQLTETDIRQMAEIVNKFESKKQYQLDTNPFGWMRVTNPDGSTEMKYVSEKVYMYDERWEFKKVGLLQWLDPEYVKNAVDCTAQIPNYAAYKKLGSDWTSLYGPKGNYDYWKRYLDIRTQPIT